MRKLASVFDKIWARAEERNNELGNQRFYRIFEKKNRYYTYCLYDGLTKKWCTFCTINLVGNYRYNIEVLPPEFSEMEQMVK